MFNKTILTIYATFLGFLPGLFLPTSSTFAADPGVAAAEGFVVKLNSVILFPLIALLMGIAFLVFLVGCAQYILGANNPSAKEQGVKHITYGIIGLVVMVSAWGILNIVAGTFGLVPPDPPAPAP